MAKTFPYWDSIKIIGASMWQRIYHFILYVIAIVLIVTAFIFTLTRAFTPLLNSHRAMFERFTSTLVHNPVSIGRIAIDWSGFQPEILLKNVTIYHANTKNEFLHIQRFYVAIDLIHSAWAREFLPSVITVSGVNLSIHQLADNVYQINDMTVNTQGSDSSIDLKKLQQWFLGQNTVSLKKINVNFVDQHQASYPVFVQELSLHNDDLKHKLNGVIRLRNTSSSVNLVINAKGDLENLQRLHVTGYAKAQNINLTNWLAKNTYFGYQILTGFGQVQVWLNWNHGHWKTQVASISVYDLQLQSIINKQIFALKSLDGDFSWQPLGNGWRVTSKELQIITPKQVWPQTQFVFEKRNLANEQSALQFQLQFADFGDTRNFLQGSSLLNTDNQQLLQNLAVSGTVNNLSYNQLSVADKIQQYQIQAGFKNLSIKNWQAIPGFNHVNAQLNANQNGGGLNVAGKNIALIMPNLFAHPILFNQLATKIRWVKKGTAWQMSVNPFSMTNQDLAINANAQIIWPKPHVLPYVNVQANAMLNNPTKVAYYLPVKGIGPHAEAWLDQAFIGGKPLLTKLVLQGNLAQFPFDQKQGVFRVDTQINSLDVHYANGWPDLKNLQGTLHFEDSKMVADINSGSSLTTVIQQAQVTIPQIKTGYPVTIQVQSHLINQAQGFLNFVQATPLKNSVGKALDRFQIQGASSLDLQLNIPLSEAKDAMVKGVLHFPGNVFTLVGWQPNITNLQGDLTFTQDSIQADKLTGIFLNQPLTASIQTLQRQNKQNIAQINFTTLANIDELKQRYMPNNNLLITGKTNVNGVLSLHLSPEDKAQSTIKLNSDLNGVIINYPPPLAKTANSTVPLNVTVNFGQDQPLQFFINYSNLLHTAWVFNQGKLFAAAIHIGKELAYAPTQQGVVIDGYFPIFDWQVWQPFLATRTKSQETESPWLKQLTSLPFVTDLHFGVLKFGAFAFNSAEVKLNRGINGWLATFITEPMQGTVTIPDNYPLAPLQARFQHIFIQPSATTSSEQDKNSSVNPKQIPAFIAQIDDLRYADKDIGQVNIQVSKIAQGVSIDKLQIKAPLFQGDLQGKWENTASGGSATSVQGVFTSANLQGLFNAWNIKSSLIANNAYFTINWSWANAPFQFNMKNVEGTAYVKLNNGWIIDLNQSTTEKLNLGRLLTLLSVRHFMFHINDLSRNGYSFDTLTGHFNISQGVIETDDLATKGVVADIKAAGQVNLVKKIIDMKLGLVVNATSSLPIIATIASGFNPLVGIATWLADKAVHKAMASVSTYSYEIKGPWSNPQITKIGSKDNETQTNVPPVTEG